MTVGHGQSFVAQVNVAAGKLAFKGHFTHEGVTEIFLSHGKEQIAVGHLMHAHDAPLGIDVATILVIELLGIKEPADFPLGVDHVQLGRFQPLAGPVYLVVWGCNGPLFVVGIPHKGEHVEAAFKTLDHLGRFKRRLGL